jgi:hypothetical protein
MMAMAWLATLLFLIGAVLLWRLARGLRERTRVALASAVGALVFLLGWLYVTGFSHLGAHVPWDDFVFFERLPAHLSALYILGLCWHLPSRVRRGLIAMLVAIAGGYGLLEISGPLLMPVYGGRLDDTTLCASGTDAPTRAAETDAPTRASLQIIQSTGWTCGPAALAWALQLRGLPVSEKQAAFLTVTTPFHGTPDRGVIRAAHRLGLRAELRRGLSYEQLMALPRPSLVAWHLGGMVLHFVVLIEMDEDGVTVGDPMLGEVDYTRAEFLRQWQRNAVVLE